MSESLFDGRDDGEGQAKDVRLKNQLVRVYEAMRYRGWLTLERIAIDADAPPASVSARIRDLRKRRFGGFQIQQRPQRSGSRRAFTGQHEYQLIESSGDPELVYDPLPRESSERIEARKRVSAFLDVWEKTFLTATQGKIIAWGGEELTSADLREVLK